MRPFRFLAALCLSGGLALSLAACGSLSRDTYSASDLAGPPPKGLAELRFSLSDAGDAGIEVLIRSGLLHRLEVLDLSYGSVTDAGAEAVARALGGRPHRLRVLNLSDNALTDGGIATLKTLGLDLHVRQQHDPDDREYLAEGNVE